MELTHLVAYKKMMFESIILSPTKDIVTHIISNGIESYESFAKTNCGITSRAIYYFTKGELVTEFNFAEMTEKAYDTLLETINRPNLTINIVFMFKFGSGGHAINIVTKKNYFVAYESNHGMCALVAKKFKKSSLKSFIKAYLCRGIQVEIKISKVTINDDILELKKMKLELDFYKYLDESPAAMRTYYENIKNAEKPAIKILGFKKN